jgi:uncharacterized protein (DUF362 family)
MDRRKFLELTGLACGAAVVSSCGGEKKQSKGMRGPAVEKHGKGKIFVGHNEDPVSALKAAIAAAGGLAFIESGSNVVLKPNVAWSRTPQQAANTDPRLVAAMIEMCKKAGAGKVTVFEHTIDRPSAQVLAISGIAAAAKQAGAELIYASSDTDFVPIEVTKGKLMKRDAVAKVVHDADVVINMPKAKHHSQTQLTLGLKNLMGVNFNRQAWHTGPNLHQYIADYATAVCVDFTVLDASRILLTNGPKGPGKIRDPQEVIVSFDPVAVDAYACGLFDMKPGDIDYILRAAEHGLGESDINKITVQRV